MLYQSGNIGPEVFGNLPYISLFISESRRKHISCGQVFIRRDGNCSQRKVFPVAKENVLWPLTGLVFAGYNALTGSPEESGPPVFRLKLNLTCFPHH